MFRAAVEGNNLANDVVSATLSLMTFPVTLQLTGWKYYGAIILPRNPNKTIKFLGLNGWVVWNNLIISLKLS